MRFWHGRLMVGLLTCALLPGCRIVEGPLAKPDKPAAKPAESAKPAPSKAEPKAEPKAETKAAPEPKSAPAPAPATAPTAAPTAAPAAEAKSPAEPTAESKPAVETKAADAGKTVESTYESDLIEATLCESTGKALAEAVVTAATAVRRQAAEEARKAVAEKRALFLESARFHLDRLAALVKTHDFGSAQIHLALFGDNLEGLRRNLGVDPAFEELQFAAAALYNVTKEAGSEEAAVKSALDHLTNALALLPEPNAKGPDALPTAPAAAEPGSLAEADPAATKGDAKAELSLARPAELAAAVKATKELLDKHHANGRVRLRDLVAALTDTSALEQLDLMEVSLRWLGDALARQSAAGALRNVERLQQHQLDELAALCNPAPAAAETPAPPKAETKAEGPSEAAPAAAAPAPAAETKAADGPKAEPAKAPAAPQPAPATKAAPKAPAPKAAAPKAAPKAPAPKAPETKAAETPAASG